MLKSSSSSSFFAVIRRNGYLVVVCVLLAGLTAFVYLNRKKTTYEASATVSLSLPAGSHMKEGLSAADHDRQAGEALAMLRSGQLLEKAFTTLGPDIAYFRDDISSEESSAKVPFKVSITGIDSNFRELSFAISPGEGGHFRISPETSGTFEGRQGAFGEEIQLAGMRFRIERKDENLTTPVNSKTHLWTVVITSPSECIRQVAEDNYRTEAIDGGASFRISFRHSVPEKTMKMANAVAVAFVQEQEGISLSAQEKELAGIDAQLAIGRQALEAARDSLSLFCTSEGISGPGQSTAALNTLNELERRKTELDTRLQVLEKTSDRLRLNREFDPLNYAHLVDPAFMKRGEQELLSGNETSRTYVLNGLSDTRRKLLLERDQVAAAVKRQRQELSVLPAREIKLQELTRSYELQEGFYRTLMDKRTAALVEHQLATKKYRVAEQATLPLTPVDMDPAVVWGLALFAGLLKGITVAFLRNRYRNVIQVPEDLRSSSAIPVIGQINRLNDNETAYRDFTALSTRILMNHPERQSWVITVTSSRKGEGKSFIATQLARTLAAQDKKVILVDLNTYDPRLGQWFEARTGNGIREVYTHQCSLQDAIQLTSIPSLDVITAGRSDQAISHLISGKRTNEILEELRSQYDVVLIDTPEVGEFVDAIPFMKWSDMNLYVVRAESGKEELIANAEMVKNEYRLEEIYYVLNAMKEKRNHTGYLRPIKQRVSGKRNPLTQLTNLF